MPEEFRNGIILGYKIQIFNSTSSLLQEFVRWPFQHSMLITGLEAFTNYTVHVGAFTSVGYGVPFAVVQQTDEERKLEAFQLALLRETVVSNNSCPLHTTYCAQTSLV